MTKKNFFISFFLIIFFSQSLLASENIKIIVKIDNEIITNFDIKNKIISTLLLANKEINQDNINSLKKRSLDLLIQNKLKKIELSKYNIKEDSSTINSYLNSISANNIPKLRLTFENYNLDFQTLVDEIKTEFKWRTFIYQKYSNKIDLDPKNINQEINDIIKDKQKQLRYNLSEIEIDSVENQIDEKKIEEIQKEIKNSNFENAVFKYSTSPTAENKGEMGWISGSTLSEEFLKILNDMKINEVSPPIKKQNKIIFIKLKGKENIQFSNENLNKIKKEIIERKKNEMFNLYSNSYISKLKNTSLIQYIK